MLTADEFFGQVDDWLTPAMTRLGYNRIGGFAGDGSNRSTLYAGDASRRSPQSAAPVQRFYDFGYEARNTDATRRIDADDPETYDEMWLSFEALTGELDLSSWHPVAAGRVPWDIARDTGPCTDADVSTRLMSVAQAVIAFAEDHGVDSPR